MYKNFEEVKPGDIGIDYGGQTDIIIDKGTWREMIEKYPNQFATETDLYENDISPDSPAVIVEEKDETLEGFTHRGYCYGHDGMIVKA